MTEEILTQAKLKGLLHYCPDTGVLTWERGHRFVGKQCGWDSNYGHTKYRLVQIEGKTYKSHRLAWLYVYGKFPENVIDHIDWNGLNNKIDNLRDVPQIINAQHRNPFHKRIPYKRRKSYKKEGISGISFERRCNKWRVRINIYGKRKQLGYYEDYFNACCSLISEENKQRAAAELSGRKV